MNDENPSGVFSIHQGDFLRLNSGHFLVKLLFWI